MKNSGRKRKISKHKNQKIQDKKAKQNKKIKEYLNQLGYKPIRILDIWQNFKQDPITYTFIIQAESVQNHSKKKLLRNKNLVKLEENFKLYLLTEFRNSLEKLSLTFQLGKWALKKLELLKSFCTQEKINIKSLRTSPKLYKNSEVYSYFQIKDDITLEKINIDNHFTNRLERKKKTRKFSVDETLLQNIEQQNPQGKVKKAENLKTVIEKLLDIYENYKDEQSEKFINDMAQVRNYFTDF